MAGTPIRPPPAAFRLLLNAIIFIIVRYVLDHNGLFMVRSLASTARGLLRCWHPHEAVVRRLTGSEG